MAGLAVMHQPGGTKFRQAFVCLDIDAVFDLPGGQAWDLSNDFQAQLTVSGGGAGVFQLPPGLPP